MALIRDSWNVIVNTTLDVAPVMAFLLLFQFFVIRERLPNAPRVLAGFAFVIVGLSLFLVGLEEALFPLGRVMAMSLTDPSLIGAADSLPEWHGYVWIFAFAFAIGFATTIAEPSLLAVAIKANEVSGGAVGVWGLRIAVALGVAAGVTLGCFRIVTGTPASYYILVGYVVVVLQTMISPRLIIPLAYDSGGVTTSTVTVPLVTALGLGLAEAVPGRNPIRDGFGLIAFASLFPIMSVLGYAQLSVLRTRIGNRRIRHEDPR